MSIEMKRRPFFVFLFLLALTFGGMTHALSDRQEINIGERMVYQIEWRYGVYANPDWQKRLDRIGAALVRHARRRLPYTIIPVNILSANAFACPGGFIIVARGLLPYLRNDDEVAAVLAHEISHVELDHFGRMYSRAQTFNWLGFAANVFTRGAAYPYVGLAGLSYQFILQPHWSRQQETEADLHGIDLMAAAGFNPNGMIELFQELQSRARGPLIPWTASHPDYADRIAAIRQEIAKLPQTPAPADADSLPPQENRRVIQGEVLPDDAPASGGNQ